MRAVWNGSVIAESTDIELADGFTYFPKHSLKADLEPTEKRSRCPWKGEAHYHTIVVDGKRLEHGAWEYVEPKEAAAHLRGRVAFWKGVTVEDPKGRLK